MYGNDYDYANGRLAGTIVRNGKYPIRVHGVRGDGICECATILRGTHKEIHLDDLDLSSPAMGFVPERSSYLVRQPKREDWRQGLRSNNVKDLIKGGAVRDVDIFKAIVGKFPPLSQVLESATFEGGVHPFHRNWAVEVVGGVIHLHYKWFGVVGCWEKEHEPQLNEGYEELSQQLQEVLDACA